MLSIRNWLKKVSSIVLEVKSGEKGESSEVKLPPAAESGVEEPAAPDAPSKK